MFILIWFQYSVRICSLPYLHSTMFIFISSSTIKGQCPLMHLHSTMFIFIFFVFYFFPLKSLIYIPLCLYLYESYVSDKAVYVFIYIPLCLYLYYFTLDILDPRTSFTFHYVYIYISSDTPISLPHSHLHSTMFIFI